MHGDERPNRPAVRAPRIPPVLADSSPFGEWVGLASAVARWAAQVTVVPGGSTAADLLLSLVGVQAPQTRLLKSIKADTALLRSEPFRTANTNLAEANRVGPGDAEWLSFVRAARKELYSAHSLALDAHEMAVVEFNLYVVWTLLGRDADARHWLGSSVASARQAVDELAWALEEHVRDDRPGHRSGWNIRERTKETAAAVTTAFVGGLTLGLAFPYLSRTMTNTILKRIGVLGDYVKFHNLVQHAMSAPDDVDRLLLTDTGNRMWQAGRRTKSTWFVLARET